ncbi:hypothetical protein BBJ28_00011186 [Nothophytophthora sp. Chile5]|nr:hypothetical protein BBJ28_00011186 [Nothophytophthora sp. Chile5]
MHDVAKKVGKKLEATMGTCFGIMFNGINLADVRFLFDSVVAEYLCMGNQLKPMVKIINGGVLSSAEAAAAREFEELQCGSKRKAREQEDYTTQILRGGSSKRAKQDGRLVGTQNNRSHWQSLSVRFVMGDSDAARQKVVKEVFGPNTELCFVMCYFHVAKKVFEKTRSLTPSVAVFVMADIHYVHFALETFSAYHGTYSAAIKRDVALQRKLKVGALIDQALQLCQSEIVGTKPIAADPSPNARFVRRSKAVQCEGLMLERYTATGEDDKENQRGHSQQDVPRTTDKFSQ